MLVFSSCLYFSISFLGSNLMDPAGAGAGASLRLTLCFLTASSSSCSSKDIRWARLEGSLWAVSNFWVALPLGSTRWDPEVAFLELVGLVSERAVFSCVPGRDCVEESARSSTKLKTKVRLDSLDANERVWLCINGKREEYKKRLQGCLLPGWLYEIFQILVSLFI